MIFFHPFTLLIIMSITFDQFVQSVESVFPNADDRGQFRNFSPDFVDCRYNPGRKCYAWQDGFEGAAYDTMFCEGYPDKRWSVSVGRGAVGYGDTIEEAVTDEAARYMV